MPLLVCNNCGESEDIDAEYADDDVSDIGCGHCGAQELSIQSDDGDELGDDTDF